mgnify:CR=1 FL=1
MENQGYWYGDSPANPGVYTCGCCRGTGVVKVAFKARYCVPCKGRGTATAAELGFNDSPVKQAA